MIFLTLLPILQVQTSLPLSAMMCYPVPNILPKPQKLAIASYAVAKNDHTYLSNWSFVFYFII